MQLNILEEEISEAISELKIKEKVKVFTGEEKNSILIKLKEIFVSGNPRVWWLSLKYKPTFFVFEEKQSYKEIVNFFNKQEDIWFVVEDEYNNGEQLLYKTKISYVIDIIGECSGFEYNIISDNFDRFLCENDHGAFLFIDRRNRKKDRLEIVKLNNKYKSFHGIKSFRITSIDELAKNERNVLDSLNKISNKANDKITLNSDYSRYISWAKEKIMPYVNYNSEIIIIDSYYLVFLFLKNIEIFLQNYFEEKECFSIYMLNRDLKKCIAIYEGEYFLEYFIRDI